MSRGFLVLNGALVVTSALFATLIVRVYVAAPDPRAESARAPASPAASAPRPTDAAPTEPRSGLTGYALVASKNLFSPTRSDTEAVAAAVAPVGPKPFLHGIVIKDGGSVAYLEDPISKRVVGYRIGDVVAGGTLQAIAPDHVVLKRGDGAMDVRLKDPAKPRPAVAEAPPQPGQTATAPQIVAPTIVRPPLPTQPAGAPPAGAPIAPPAQLRRLPLSPTGRDAAGQ